MTAALHTCDSMSYGFTERDAISHEACGNLPCGEVGLMLKHLDTSKVG